ncbi:MAG: hypothetical protein HYT79_07235 [Elusimicrobia bacterium]|nr:hypothetical protein [Elusimicrobiota bacterium]
MKKQILAAGMLTALAACAPRPLFVIRNQETAAHVKKVAIMPFLDAQFQSAYDPHYSGLGSSFVPALMFDNMAKKHLSKRFEIIGQDQSLEALKKEGVEYKHIKGAWSAVRDPESIRWGYTPSQALAAGKKLGADAILLCVQGQYFKDKKKPLQAIGLRLIDVKTGKTLWGVNATGQPGLLSKGVVVRQLLARVAKEAP